MSEETVRTFNDYQSQAVELSIYRGSETGNFVTAGDVAPFLGLGEVGELQGKVKKLIRDHHGDISPDDRLALIDELGDVLWYLSYCAKWLGYTLQEVAERNLEKLHSRKARGVIGGSGDNR